VPVSPACTSCISWTYGYSFSKELSDEWNWEEHFAAQPETERYLNYVAEWTDHVKALGQGTLVNEVNSWMTGVNSNVEGKQIRRIMRYAGIYPSFREHCDAVAADG
jgi:hypothetical protein